jgi:aquaglyceroporin related protein
MATGRDMEEQSMNFTLAGPGPMDSQAANQPYVEPGYSDLNPAYDQPINTRPVWGLAKPLPRVVRPGMIPTRSELKIQIPEAEGRRQDPENVDLEQGRVEPTLNLGKITSQLQNARQDRENRFIQGNLQRTGTGFSPASPLARRQTHASSHVEPFSPGSHAIEEEEEEDLGLAKPRPNDLAPVPEQPLDPVPGQGNQPEGEQGWYPDDAASAMTEKLGADDLDGDWIGDEVPLKAYDPESDEIHNLHTHWSVIRLRFREPLAELLAVICQLTLGFCADLVVVTSSSKAGNEATTDWAWGLATMVGIYIAGGISGAHLNPAISIMLWIYRGFPLRKVPIYMAAQILGAFIAALIAFGLYQEGIVSFANGATLGDSGTTVAFLCYPRQTYIGGATAFFTEFTSTSILAVAVLALGDDTNAPPGAGMNALVLGLLITVLSMAFGYNTGAAMNPARDLGPRLALLAVGYGSEIFTNPYWVYGNWVGPITGAIFGAFLYDAAIFVGGESPVNYPRKRIARASKKWQRRWGKRLSRTRRRIVAGGRKEDGFEGVKGRDLR